MNPDPSPLDRLITRIGEVNMDFNYESAFEKYAREAYERLFIDCVRGDHTLFARADGVLYEWRAMDPYIKACEQDQPQVYEPGSEGPTAAAELIARDGRAWRPLT